MDDDYDITVKDEQAPGPSMPGPMMPSMGPGDVSDYDFSSDAAYDALPPLPKAGSVSSNKYVE